MEESVLAAAVRLTSAVEGLAALAAHVRVRTQGLDVDDAIGSLLAAAAEQIVGSADIDADPSAMQALGMATAFLRESVALVNDPGRIGGWATTDPEVLQGVGRLSMSIAPVIADAASVLSGLADLLSAQGAQLLDVGTGTGWLAIALARTFPSARVTGIDIYEPSLAIARQNIATQPGGDRVTIAECDVTMLDGPERFDAIWLPLPFLPKDIVPAAITRCADRLNPGGWLLPGTFAGPPDPLARILTDLRIVRSGGYPWTTEELIAMMAAAGLEQPQSVDRRQPAPVQLFAGRRPS